MGGVLFGHLVKAYDHNPIKELEALLKYYIIKCLGKEPDLNYIEGIHMKLV